MFGWLAAVSPSICRFSSGAPLYASRQWLRLSPPQLARQLPLLGSVLYVTARPASAEPWVDGVLLAQRELAPLLQARWFAAASVVTEDGPREWLECLDQNGELRARLHLLPDTDYLAWDALLQDAEAKPPSLRALRHRGLRSAAARVVAFRHRELAGIGMLEAIEHDALSSLGRQAAQRIAQAEAVPLRRG